MIDWPEKCKHDDPMPLYAEGWNDAIDAYKAAYDKRRKVTVKEIEPIILNAQESIEKTGRDIRLLQSDRRTIAQAIIDYVNEEKI